MPGNTLPAPLSRRVRENGPLTTLKSNRRLVRRRRRHSRNGSDGTSGQDSRARRTGHTAAGVSRATASGDELEQTWRTGTCAARRGIRQRSRSVNVEDVPGFFLQHMLVYQQNSLNGCWDDYFRIGAVFRRSTQGPEEILLHSDGNKRTQSVIVILRQTASGLQRFESQGPAGIVRVVQGAFENPGPIPEFRKLDAPRVHDFLKLSPVSCRGLVSQQKRSHVHAAASRNRKC